MNGVDTVGKIKNSLGQGCFTGVDMGADTNVSDFFCFHRAITFSVIGCIEFESADSH
jgi:hypothetical protein